jgi:hypothetical protein
MHIFITVNKESVVHIEDQFMEIMHSIKCVHKHNPYCPNLGMVEIQIQN